MSPVGAPKPAKQQQVIGPRIALVAAVRLWFLYRDEALWTLMGGDDPDQPLATIEIDDEFHGHVSEANDAYRQALRIAERIAAADERKVATVLREAIDELLQAERPRFLLTLEHIPGSF